MNLNIIAFFLLKHKSRKEEIKKGDSILDVFCNSNDRLNSALPLIKNAVTLSNKRVKSPKLIYK